MQLQIILQDSRTSHPKDPFRILDDNGESLWGIEKFIVQRREWSDKTFSFMDITSEIIMPKEVDKNVHITKIRESISNTIKKLKAIGVVVHVKEMDAKEFVMRHV